MTEPPWRKSAADFHPEVLRLFDQYVHGSIDRRGFLDGAARFAAGGVGAAALLEALSPKFALAQQVQKTDPRIRTEMLTIDSLPSDARSRIDQLRKKCPKSGDKERA